MPRNAIQTNACLPVAAARNSVPNSGDTPVTTSSNAVQSNSLGATPRAVVPGSAWAPAAAPRSIAGTPMVSPRNVSLSNTCPSFPVASDLSQSSTAVPVATVSIASSSAHSAFAPSGSAHSARARPRSPVRSSSCTPAAAAVSSSTSACLAPCAPRSMHPATVVATPAHATSSRFVPVTTATPAAATRQGSATRQQMTPAGVFRQVSAPSMSQGQLPSAGNGSLSGSRHSCSNVVQNLSKCEPQEPSQKLNRGASNHQSNTKLRYEVHDIQREKFSL
jgi:hypothetical protein